MLYINKNHVLPRCKILSSLEAADTEAAIQGYSVNKCFENLRATMKGFL